MSLNSSVKQTVKIDIELAPCPFCGEEDRVELGRDYTQVDGDYMVFCLECAAQGPHDLNETQAVMKWNARKNEK